MAEHTIFLIHGIGDNTPDVEYAELEKGVARAYDVAHGEGRFAAGFHFVHVLWHEIAEEAQEAIYLDAFGKPPIELSVLGMATHPIESLRTVMTFFVGDVVAYASPNDNQIRRSVWAQLKDSLRGGQPFSIVGHSLGSVIAFDFLYELFQRNRIFLPGNRGEEDSALVQPMQEQFRGLYTLGSPIGLLTLRQGALWLDKSESTAFREIRNPLPASGTWLNFWDAQDVIAYPLERLFARNPENRTRPLSDVEVSTGLDPLRAHLRYWSDREVAQRIAETLP